MRSVSHYAGGRFSYSPKRKRVLMVVESLARGGAERQMFALADGLLRRGYKLHVFELIGLVADQAGFVEEFARIGVRSRRAGDFFGPAAVLFPNTPIAALQPFAPLLPANIASIRLR